MATKKLFWQDPYLSRLDTHLTSVKADKVTLAETIFYAFSGGQESDAGTIGGPMVLEARKDGKEIIYVLDNIRHGFKADDPVTVAIDWERRYRLMRLHFAAELVLELSYRTFENIQKIGAHIAQDKSRIDFAWPESLSTALPMLKDQAMVLIEADHAITSAFSDEENQRRYWEIDGFARVACGGTHLKRTGEIGSIELHRKNVGKGKERIEISLVE
jgi:Ser-tRNA(Ala) deacylase AlaX